MGGLARRCKTRCRRAPPNKTLTAPLRAATSGAPLPPPPRRLKCPFCERVWLALEHKGLPYETDYIDLQNKPEWYKELVPTALVPAVRFSADGELVWESMAILEQLDERFPGTPPLMPADGTEARERVERFVALGCAEGDASVAGVGYKLLTGGGFGSSGTSDEELAALREELDQAVETAEEFMGAGLVAGDGKLSLADVLIAPAMERLEANLKTFRGYDLREKLGPWFDAMAREPAYQRVKGDAETHNTVVRQLFGIGKDGALPAPRVDLASPQGCAEASLRLSTNLEAVVGDAIKNSGVDKRHKESIEEHFLALAEHLQAAAARGESPAASRPPSPFPRPTIAQIKAMDKDALEAAKAAAAEKRAAGAAALAFLRNRVSAPRDMTADGAVALRAGCDAMIASLY